MKMYNSTSYIKHVAKTAKPSMRYNYDCDFSKWRENAKSKLEELLGLPFEKCEDCFTVISESDKDGYKKIDFEFQSEEGYFVSASFLLPKGASEKRPCVICLQGHSTGMHISLGEPKFEGDANSIAGGRDIAVRAVKEGCCAVAMEQRYMGTAGQNEKGRSACLLGYSARTLLMGRTAIGERVWDVQRLIDVIFKHFSEYVDTEKTVCLGNSGGGTVTFYASCMDERIKVAVPSCSVCTYDASIIALHHCNCNYIPSIRKYFDMGDIGALIAPRKLLVVCGEKDDIFPLGGVKESYELIRGIYKMLGKEEDCALVIGEGGHQFYPDKAWPLIHKYIGK